MAVLEFAGIFLGVLCLSLAIALALVYIESLMDGDDL